jgi:hypothetical protein
MGGWVNRFDLTHATHPLFVHQAFSFDVNSLSAENWQKTE